jgi:hypothetical protein
MSSDVVANPPPATASGESKGARKKKAKGGATAAVPVPTEKTSSEVGAGGSDPAGKAHGGDSDNSYIRELQK